jgi:hypothetical protein
MKKAWAKDLVVAGSGRADLDSESRRLMTAFTKMKKNDDGTPNREFMAFLARLETRPIVAPTKNAAEALRHVSNAYIVGLEQARAAASQKILDDRAKRMADTKMNVIIDRDDAKRLISVWEVGYAADKAAYEAAKDPAEKEALKKKLQMQLPTMTKHETGVMIAHQSLPTVYGRVAEPKTIESLRDGHPITVVDLKAMKQGLAQLGPIWDKLEIKMEGYRVKAYGPHSVEEPKKTLAAADQRMKASEMVI